jgi:hypothetical protein
MTPEQPNKVSTARRKGALAMNDQNALNQRIKGITKS